MPITDWPIEDRPREKLLIKGERELTNAELLAIFLQSGTAGQSALDIAKALITEHGGLKKLLRAPLSSFLAKRGLGKAKYALIKAAAELGRRYFEETIPLGEALKCSRHTQQFLADRLREKENEVFACLFLDNHLRLLRFDILFQGSINEAHVYPREIARQCLSHNAAKIILAHNHPSGKSDPSESDKTITDIIQQALALIEVELIDHIIIGNPENFSFAEAGLL